MYNCRTAIHFKKLLMIYFKYLCFSYLSGDKTNTLKLKYPQLLHCGIKCKAFFMLFFCTRNIFENIFLFKIGGTGALQV